MRKNSILILVIAAAAMSLVAASDPWKDKPYKEWTAEDIQKIMTDSPWARTVSVAASWRGTTGSAVTPTIGQERGGAPQRDTNDRGTSADTGGQNQAQFYVRWGSSQMVRQALVRNAELRGTPEEKAEQMLAKTPETYVVTVSGPDMTPFTKSDEMALKEKAYLLAKKTKQKLAPDRVEIRRRPNSQQILDVVFYFSKKSASGEATVSGDEKQIEFACETPLTKVKTTFDLAKMNGGNGAADL